MWNFQQIEEVWYIITLKYIFVIWEQVIGVSKQLQANAEQQCRLLFGVEVKAV